MILIVVSDILLVVIDSVGSDIMGICTMNGYILYDFHDSVVCTLHDFNHQKSREDLKSERWTYPLPLGSRDPASDMMIR